MTSLSSSESQVWASGVLYLMIVHLGSSYTFPAPLFQVLCDRQAGCSGQTQKTLASFMPTKSSDLQFLKSQV
ncbi:hypothetical protein CROQUDRAFT_659728 [Cronartium quercuum f. sp. fusiforme G11]|uniref:Uncharacterized protein n=1 Tax=Cronartium quercuum f. sp. fusiforme G11 TaxID=708437 RepID=A0A9P6NI93_9BASI|nr:hypothetical protein CROQUDRAFT_659728 [Cronartium quercuum f. sp. fusiforme G11]